MFRTSRPHWGRPGAIAPLMMGLALWALNVPQAQGQASPPAAAPATPSPDYDKKLEDVEKQLDALRKAIEELRKNSPKSATSSGPEATPEPKGPPAGLLPNAWANALKWRSIGPASMGGRITALSVFEADPSTYFVATASGGLLKTVNAGTTFEHQFDRESSVSIGDVCVAPSNKDVIWVGTGESNPRNSVSYGDGVYKSVDGGKKWTNMGLKGSFQTGKIKVHPTNPDIVYVGALGRLYGESPERGLFKTTDGGKTWSHVLKVDDKTGVIDMVMHPTDPETLIVATWERKRDGFDSHRGEPALSDGYDAYDPIVKWGPGSGLHKTTDGGKTFKKLTAGLPTSPMGRIGLDWYRKDPKVVFAIVDCERIGTGVPPSRAYLGVIGENAEGGAGAKLTEITENGPAAKAGLKPGDVIKSVDKKSVANYEAFVAIPRAGKPGDKLALEVLREGKTIEVVVTLEERPREGGRPDPRSNPRLAVGLALGAFGEDAEGGHRLGRILPGRAGELAGLNEGDLIQQADDKPANQEALAALVNSKKEGDKVALKVLREGKTIDVSLAIASPESAAAESSFRNRPFNYMYGGQQPNVQDQQGPTGATTGGLYRSDDMGETWTRINSINPRPMYFSQVRVDPSDDKNIYVLGVSLHRSKDGGKNFTADGGERVHSDQHALWIDPKDGRRAIVGCDGGFYVTYDRMQTWDHLNHLAIGQFYHVALDSKRPYRVYGGMQDNGSWGGPSQTLDGVGPINEDWIVVGQGDGFVCRVDPFDPDLVYFESQDGVMGRRNLRTGERASISPRREPGKRYQFNWNTPFLLSSHNPGIFYAAGNYVFRSYKRGDDLRAISPQITTTGRGTATALAESPRSSEVLWAGTDDGNLWVSKDGGKAWTNVAEKVGLPAPRWVSTIEASRFAEGRAFVCFDAHRSNDDEPCVYGTEDFGQTWKSLRGNLPSGWSRTLREDVTNPDLLYCGTELGIWASLDRGTSWTKINSNLPTVPVFEVALHPTAGELVAATHGRSFWVLDVLPLRGMSAAKLKEPATLFAPNTVVRWRPEPTRGSPYGNGHRKFIGENPPRGAQISYALTAKAEKVELKVLDYAGQVVRTLQAKAEPGLHVVPWDLSRQPANRPPGTGGGGGGGGGGGRGGLGGGGSVPIGTYRVVLVVDGKEQSQPLKIEQDPTLPVDAVGGELEAPAREGDEDDDGFRIDD